MADINTMWLNILSNEEPDIKKICELSADQREFAQHKVLEDLLLEISTTLAPYFKLVGDLVGDTTGMRTLGGDTKRDGTDANLERLVAAGLASAKLGSNMDTKEEYINANETQILFERTKSLLTHFKDKPFTTGTNNQIKYEFSTAAQVAGIFSELQTLAKAGAKLLKIQDEEMISLSSGNEINDAFQTFLHNRIGGFIKDLDKINATGKQKKLILSELLMALSTEPAHAFNELTMWTGPSSINRLVVPLQGNFPGEAKFGLLILLRQRENKVISKRIKSTTTEFLKTLYNSDQTLAFSGDLANKEKFKQRFAEKMKRRCKAGPVDDLGKINKSAASAEEKRIQNLKCILPLFEDAYSTKRGPAGLESTSNLAPFGIRDIAFDLASSTKSLVDPGVKINQQHYKADQFPLLFSNSANSHFFMNRLFSQDQKGEQLKSFMEVTNADVSKLMPKIQVYKVLYDNNRNEVEIPIEFSNKTEVTAAGEYLRENAGISRVSFTRTGQNPATVKRYLTCKLNLYFDSINSFLKKRKTTSGKEYSYVDFLRRSSEYNPIKGSDLRTKLSKGGIQSALAMESGDFSAKYLGTKEESTQDLANKFNDLALSDYNGDYFQIKINVGWAINPDLYGSTPKDIKAMQKLNKFINSTNLTLYLTLMTHDFNFGNDGTLSLNLSYMGRLQQKIRDFDANIFSEHGLDKKIKSASVIGQVIAALRGDTSTKKDSSQELTNLGRLKSKLMAQIEAGKDDLRGQLWETLINEDGKMVKLSNGSPDEKNVPTHILKATIDEEFLGSGNKIHKGLSKGLRKQLGRHSRADVVLNPGEMLHHAYTRLLTDEDASTALKINQVYRRGKKFRAGDKDFSLKPGPQTSRELQKQRNSRKGKPKTLFKEKGKKFSFYTVRFGSVIQAAVQNIWNNNPQALESIGILMGPIKFKGLDGQDRLTNICHIPILLEEWKAFMARNVVAEDKTSYNLLHFIRDAVHELLIPALGQTCKDNERLISPLRNVKIKAMTASARRNPEFKVQPQADNLTYKKLQIDIDKKFGGKNAKKPIFSKKLIGNSNVVSPVKGDLKHYIILYDAGSSADPTYVGNDKLLYKRNLTNNIPHFFIGANKGILKTIGFRKTEVQFLQEARVIDNGDTDFGLLREKYDASLSVVGNPHFTQGMKLYIDPTLTGFSNSDYKDIVQRDLGLGGYYDIVGVTSTIDANSFDTEIQASWVAFAPKKSN